MDRLTKEQVERAVRSLAASVLLEHKPEPVGYTFPEDEAAIIAEYERLADFIQDGNRCARTIDAAIDYATGRHIDHQDENRYPFIA